MTYTGLCCSFNYNPSNSSYEPLSVNSYGVRGGLSVIATSFPHVNDGTSGLLFSNGFVVFIHSPHDFPTESTSMALLEVGKITSIGVYPTFSTVSADVKALPLVSRKCMTGSDNGLNIYSQASCATRCMTEFIHEKCECHPYFLPVMDGTWIRDCSVIDGECFQRIYCTETFFSETFMWILVHFRVSLDELRKIRCRRCLPACEEVSYRMTTATVSYNFGNVSVNPI